MNYVSKILAALALAICGSAHATTDCTFYVGWVGVINYGTTPQLYVGLDNAQTTGTGAPTGASFYLTVSDADPGYKAVAQLAAMSMALGKQVMVRYTATGVTCNSFTGWRTDMVIFETYGGRN